MKKPFCIAWTILISLFMAPSCLAQKPLPPETPIIVDAENITTEPNEYIVDLTNETAEPDVTTIATTEATTPEEIIDIHTDVLFIGNSLTSGIQSVHTDSNQFICKVGISLDGINLKSMYNMDFKVVVINMGTNELGAYTEQRFKESYINLIRKIQEYNPDARIICCSVPPIRQLGYYAAQYNTQNANLYTTYIQEVARQCNVEFLDNAQFFGDELNPQWTGDGIHFYGTVYEQWYEFLLNEIQENHQIV